MTTEELQKWYDFGLIKKADLIDGKEYKGQCRNANSAIWHADKQCFTYIREKFGHSFPEDIKHPEDDDGFDIFICLTKENP